MSHSAIGHAPEEKYHHGKSPAANAFAIIFMIAVVVGVFAMVPSPKIGLLIVAGVIALVAWIVWIVLRGMGRDNV
jgi:prepilin signal peptidase PulO-like enzyme (type II secretory pathway)